PRKCRWIQSRESSSGTVRTRVSPSCSRLRTPPNHLPYVPSFRASRSRAEISLQRFAADSSILSFTTRSAPPAPPQRPAYHYPTGRQNRAICRRFSESKDPSTGVESGGGNSPQPLVSSLSACGESSGLLVGRRRLYCRDAPPPAGIFLAKT